MVTLEKHQLLDTPSSTPGLRVLIELQIEKDIIKFEAVKNLQATDMYDNHANTQRLVAQAVDALFEKAGVLK